MGALTTIIGKNDRIALTNTEKSPKNFKNRKKEKMCIKYKIKKSKI